MSDLLLSKGLYPEEFFRPTVEFLLATQLEDGSIPWSDGNYADPWDHVEAAMALTIGGEYQAAEKAYFWLRDLQLEDGSWWAAYKDGEIHNKERRETNFVAYIATGVWHHYLISQNLDFVKEIWPCVTKAIEFVVGLQSEYGEIAWAIEDDGTPKDDALITGCSSIYKSLECAYNLSVILEQSREDWLLAREALGHALRHKPERFDRNWESKARYSMDWFYPILTGVLSEQEAKRRIADRWSEFVVDDMGCRCVSDQPWVTVAESCELTMALLAAGERAKAVKIYSWLHQWRYDDGSYWTGYQFVEDLLWPDERPTWTAAAIILAADALTDYSAAAHIFKEVRLLSSAESVRKAR